MAATKLEARKIVFLGAGNMAEALVNGLIRGGVCSPLAITVSDVRPERLELFHKEHAVAGTAQNTEAVKGAEIIVLAVKPQTVGEILGEIRDARSKTSLVITIAAGIRTARVEEGLGEGCRVVRVMPNTPALVRCGAAALCGGRWATEKDLGAAETMMHAVGMAVRVKEEDMDAVTALSGSGPAYAFYFMEAMLAAAKEFGLDEAVARGLIYKTFEGAARLAAETGLDPAELRRRVTSKGGTTAAAVDVLNGRRVTEAFVEAILAARRRAAELSGA